MLCRPRWFFASLRGFDPEQTWVKQEVPLDDEGEHAAGSVRGMYITGVYWAVTTLTTVGYGDFSPVSPEERLTTCICAPPRDFHVVCALPQGSAVTHGKHGFSWAARRRFGTQPSHTPCA